MKPFIVEAISTAVRSEAMHWLWATLRRQGALEFPLTLLGVPESFYSTLVVINESAQA